MDARTARLGSSSASRCRRGGRSRISQPPPGAVIRQLPERRHVVLAASLIDRDLESMTATTDDLARALDTLDDRFDRDRRIPDLECPHPGVAPHPLAVLPGDEPPHVAAGVFGEAVLPRGHDDARGEPLDVPLPRTAVRLVEVVDVEHEPPLRAGEDAEVGEVRVAAQLDLRADDGGVREVGRHDRRRAAQERERRGQHPADADRDQLWKPALVRRGERVDDVAPVCGGRPTRHGFGAGPRPAGPGPRASAKRGRAVRWKDLGRVVDHAGTASVTAGWCR